MQLTPNFSLLELTRSATAQKSGINNQPSEEILKSLIFTACGLERVRAAMGNKPMRITSGFRCEALNKAVGGARRSQHMNGEAVDFQCPNFSTPRGICLFLAERVAILGIDQLIMEVDWVHISFTTNPRYEVLTLTGRKYVSGIL